MKPVPLFVELCAGLAAVSVRLQGGRHARPPVSRMGNKAGYATAILAAMGLRPGQGAERFLWCEPDPGCRALLTAYTDPALMREAADIIRGWKDEEPRALWERLRAEGPIREATGAEVARWVWVHGRSIAGLGTGYLETESERGDVRRARGMRPENFADRLGRTGLIDGAVATGDARIIDPSTLPPGTVVYIDPPYAGTTGYGCDLPRAEVVRLARLWSEAGALVVISEAEPVEALRGWPTVEITGERRGQKRTWSKQQREWLTMNREPVARPMVQGLLWGAA